MEDLLILLLQGLGQIILEILAYLPWDLFWYGDSLSPATSRDEGKFAVCVVSFLAGAVVGYISVYFFPNTFVHWAWLRIALLAISPLASGFIALEFARAREQKRTNVEPWFHFWLALCFSAGLIWLRFALAHRPV